MLRRFVVLIAALAPLGYAAEIRVVEEIAAKVNGEIITRSELDQTQKEMENEFRGSGLAGAPLARAVDQMKVGLLRDKIDELLLVQKAREDNINVEPDVTRFVANLQVRSGITDADKFAQYIREQFGVPLEDLKLRQRNQLLTQREVSQQVASRIFIPEDQLRKYYEDHKSEYVRQEEVYLSQILISTQGKTADQVAEAEKKAKELVARARQGEKFAEMAAANSDDAETGRSGGYLGAYKRTDLRKEISDLVFSHDKGYVTDPIKLENPNGFLILKVEERYQAGQATFEEVKEEVQGAMAEPQMGPKVRELLNKLRLEAFLEIREGYTDAGAVPGKDTTWHDVAQIKPETTTKEEVAARRRKKFLWLIPYGRAGAETPATAAPAPASSSPASQAAPVQK